MRAHKLLRVRCWLLMCCARLNGDLRKHSDGFGSPAHKLSSDVGRQSFPPLGWRRAGPVFLHQPPGYNRGVPGLEHITALS